MNKAFRLLRYDWPLHFVLLLTNFLPDNVFILRLRGFLARPFFKRCGKQLGIGRNVVFYNPSKIELGNWVYIAYGCWFSASEAIEINDEVLFGPYNVITDSNHSRYNSSYRFGLPSADRIIFGKGCWIGASCTILKGSVIGDGTVIGANSVVSGNVPENCVFAGNPGSVKKAFND
jgi:acetyltransferase-like isoleucine patch superfamily enzyme